MGAINKILSALLLIPKNVCPIQIWQQLKKDWTKKNFFWLKRLKRTTIKKCTRSITLKKHEQNYLKAQFGRSLQRLNFMSLSPLK